MTINNKLMGLLGLLTPIIFIVGFLVLFTVNAKAYEELNNLSISGYNLSGIDGELWIELT